MSSAVAAPLTGISKVFGGLKSAITSALGPLGMVLNILESLGMIQPLLDLLNGFIQILGQAFVPVLMMLMGVITPLLAPFQELITAITPLITLVMTLLLPIGLLQSVLPFIIMGIEWLANVITMINPFIVTLQAALAQLNFMDMIAGIWAVIQVFGNLIMVGINLVTSLFSIGDGFNQMMNNIGSILMNAFEPIITWFSGIWERIGDAIEASWNSTGQKIVDFFT